jgi:hypothetical protein
MPHLDKSTALAFSWTRLQKKLDPGIYAQSGLDFSLFLELVYQRYVFLSPVSW